MHGQQNIKKNCVSCVGSWQGFIAVIQKYPTMTVLLCTSISCFLLFCKQTGKDVELCLNKLIDKNEAKTYVRENVLYTRNTKNQQLK
jgi:hypothetical protein